MSIEDLSGRGEFVPLVELKDAMDLRTLRNAHNLNSKYHRFAIEAYDMLRDDVISGHEWKEFPVLGGLVKNNMEARILMADNLQTMMMSMVDRKILISRIRSSSLDDQLEMIQSGDYPTPSVTPELRDIMTKISSTVTSEERQVLMNMAITHIRNQYLSQYEMKFAANRVQSAQT